MAFGITFDISGMTHEQYARMVQQLNRKAKGAPGFLVHISGPTETGYRVTEVWESEEDRNRFAMEHVLPLFQQARIPPAVTQTFSVENVVTA